MGSQRSLPEEYKIVDVTAGCVTTNGGVTTDIVSLKNAHKAWLMFQLTQAVGHATALVPWQCTNVAAGGAKVLTNVVPIWANEDTAASDALVAQTAAVNYTVTNDIKKKQVIFEIDPATLDVANGFDCIKVVIADSSQATDFVAGQFVLQERYKQATPPSAIID